MQASAPVHTEAPASFVRLGNPRIARVSRIKFNFLPGVWPNPGPGRLTLDAGRGDVEFVGVFETIASFSSFAPDFILGTPYTYTTTGFGLSKNEKMAGLYHFLVHVYANCVKIPQFVYTPPRGRAVTPLWCLYKVLYF